MSAESPCSSLSSVDKHFSGRLTPEDERALRAHLSGCAQCRDRYDRQLLLARLDPRSLSQQERIGSGLGFRVRRPRNWLPAVAILAPATAALALALVVSPGADETGFTARGGTPAAATRLLVYRSNPGNEPAPVRDTVEPGDELAFAYENDGEARFLMVFGVDEHRHVYWYHPAWTDPDANPAAIPIAPTEGVRELPEAIRHALDGTELELRALFLREPVTVRDVEGALKAVAPGAPLELGEAAEDRIRLRIRASGQR